MTKSTYERGRKIRQFILQNIPEHPHDIVNKTVEHFSISRQAVNRYIQELIKNEYITAKGNTRQRTYSLRIIHKILFTTSLVGLEEDALWRDKISELFKDYPQNVLDIWHYSFTEMVNNAIDHSEGTEISVAVEINGYLTRILIHDDGVGIFRKIRFKCIAGIR